MKNKTVFIIIFFYTIVSKLLTSLHSILYDRVTMEVDGICFYLMGKAIKEGKVLYKDIFDHKTPYIYFLNTLASFLDRNHIGLFILEIICGTIILIYTYKIYKLVFDYHNYSNTVSLSLIGTFVMSVLYSIRSISIGYNRTETYAVAFFLPSVYIFIKYFFQKVDEYSLKNNMLFVGVLAGLTFMTNIKAAILFVPFAITTLVIFIYKKQYKFIIPTFVYGILGVFISIVPYVVYVIFTGSFDDMVFALIKTNISYNDSVFLRNLETPFGDIFNYNPNNGFLTTVLAYFKVEPIVMILLLLSFALLLILKYNKYLKVSLCMSFIFAFMYIMLSRRVHTYYLFVTLPYMMVLYIFITSLIRNKLYIYNKLIHAHWILCIIIMVSSIFISFLFNNNDNKIINNDSLKCSKEIKQIVSSYNENIKSLKVLSIGFRPEIYLWLDVPLKYKYFIIPSVLYSVDKTYCTEQYNYVYNNDPDIVVISNKKSFTNYPENLKMQTLSILNDLYLNLGTISTINNDVQYYIYGKKR